MAAASVEARSTLVSVVAPSEGGGVIASEVVVAGDPIPVSVAPLTAALLNAAARSLEDAGSAVGPLMLAVPGETAVVVIVGVEVPATSSAGLVVIGAVEVTSRVVGTVVVVVVDVTVSVVGTVTGWIVVVVVVTVVASVEGPTGVVGADALIG